MTRFQHFEHIADTQMLAMLSCVLSKSPMANPSQDAIDTGNRRPPSKNHKMSSIEMGQAKGASSDYYPSLEVAMNMLRTPPPKLFNQEKPPSAPQSTSSSAGATTSDPLTPFSTGATPPNIHRPIVTTLERKDSQKSTILAPPEHQRNTSRTNSNLASTFAASLSRPFSFNTSMSSSPPTTYLRKRLSPAGSYIGAPSAGVNWGAASFFSKTSTITEDPKSVYPLSISDTEEDITAPKSPVFVTKLKNQDQFDNEGYANVSLLDPSQSWRYYAYRGSYAHMLFTWDLPLARCEILKYNDRPSSVSDFPPKFATGLSPSLISIGRSTAESPEAHGETGLRLGFIIHRKTPHSENSQRLGDPPWTTGASSKSPLICLLCAEIVRGLSSPCLACGHVLHASCRSMMLAQNIAATEDGECISGCGCLCVHHSTVKVDPPPLHQMSPSQTVVRTMSNEQRQYGWRAESGNDEDAWEDIAQEDVAREDVAYESLARVRERYITPKPSQIWRGGPKVS